MQNDKSRNGLMSLTSFARIESADYNKTNESLTPQEVP